MNSIPEDSNHSDPEQQETFRHYDQKKKQQQNICFGNNSVPMKCPFCFQYIKSQIIAKPQLVSIALGLLLFSLLPNAIMIVVIIIVIQITATKKHRCPLCERELGSDGKFLRIFNDEVYSFSLQDNGILISKKIIVSGLILVGIICVLYIRTVYFPDLPQFTNLTWPQLMTVCPKNSVSITCKNDVQGKTVQNWKGFIMKVNDQRENFRKYYEHAVRLYIKMDPAENSFELPDLILTANSGYAYRMTEVLDDLSHGDQIMFNATFAFSKTENHVDEMRHMHLIGLQKTNTHNPSVHIYLTDQQKELLKPRPENSLRKHEQQEENKKSIKTKESVEIKESEQIEPVNLQEAQIK